MDEKNGLSCLFRIAVGIYLIFLMTSGFAEAEIAIDSCLNITSPGTYVLNQSIINTYGSTCITITSGNVVLDGAGYTIDGVLKTYPQYGIFVYNATMAITNVTIKNLIVTDWYNGIECWDLSDSNLINNTANSNNDSGLSLYHSFNNTIKENKAEFNNYTGISLGYSSENNVNQNIVTNNRDGIVIYSLNGYSEPTRFNTLRGNSANSNSRYGIYINGCYYPNNPNTYLCTYNNTFIENTAEFNGKYGIYIANSVQNIVEKNVANSNNDSGILLLQTKNNLLRSNDVSYNIDGIYISNYNSGNTLTNNTITFNEGYGLKLWAAYSNNIYNNLLNNNNNVVLTSVDGNKWNTTKISGSNIIGSHYIGGNFWGDPTGTGFSQTCTDADSDGICDSPYSLDSNNTDFLPLAYNTSPTPTPTPTTSPTPSPTPTPTVTPTPTPTPIVGTKGDANGDGSVTIVDSLFVAQYTVGTRNLTSTQLAAADVSGDGQVTIVDALFIAQYTVGLRQL